VQKGRGEGVVPDPPSFFDFLDRAWSRCAAAVPPVPEGLQQFLEFLGLFLYFKLYLIYLEFLLFWNM